MGVQKVNRTGLQDAPDGKNLGRNEQGNQQQAPGLLPQSSHYSTLTTKGLIVFDPIAEADNPEPIEIFRVSGAGLIWRQHRHFKAFAQPGRELQNETRLGAIRILRKSGSDDQQMGFEMLHVSVSTSGSGRSAP